MLVRMVRVKTDVGMDGADGTVEDMLVRMVRVKIDVGTDGTGGTVLLLLGVRSLHDQGRSGDE